MVELANADKPTLGWVIVNVLVVLQLFPSEVNTVYVPATKPAILDPLVFDGNHVYVYTLLPP